MKKTPPLLTGTNYTIHKATRSGEQWSVEATVDGVKRTYTVLGPADKIFKAVNIKASPFEVRMLESNSS